MKPFWDARVGDLGPGDLVKVECLCGHTEMLTGAMLRTAGLSELEPSSTIAVGQVLAHLGATHRLLLSRPWRVSF
jgi:hypothetical protein